MTPRKLTPAEEKAWAETWDRWHREAQAEQRRQRVHRVIAGVRAVWMSDAFWLVVILLLAVFAMAGVVTVIEHMDWVDSMARGEQ